MITGKIFSDHPSIILKKNIIKQPKVDTYIIRDDHLLINTYKKMPNIRLVYLNVEPEGLLPVSKLLIENYSKFDFILTYNQTVLDKCPNAYKYVYGTSWISKEDYESINTKKKKFKLTFIISSKKGRISGHQFRHLIYHNQSLITNIPFQIFVSARNNELDPKLYNNDVLPEHGPSKIITFYDAQFHLTVENSRQLNYFTEKIVDCLITRTIPIYYGCPNIHEYFNTTGWIILEDDSLNTLIDKIKVLDTNYYNKYLDIIEENFKNALKYKDMYKTLNETLDKITEW